MTVSQARKRLQRFPSVSRSSQEIPMTTEPTALKTPYTLLRRRQVEIRVGAKRSTLYDWMRKGDFPKPIKVGERTVAWIEQEVDAWINQRIQKSRS
jgi:prophage regulatory protein